jgi:uncharacterized protein involved in exopolysaccharide biosynthesis
VALVPYRSFIMVIKTATQKRKELDDEIAHTTSAFSRAVIFSPRIANDGMHWGDCQSRLQDIMKSCNSASLYRDDPFLEDLATIAAHPELKTLQSQLSRNVTQAKQAHSSIVQKISHLKKRFQDESSTITSLEEKFQSLSMQSNDLSQQYAALQEQIQEATAQSESYRARIDAAESTVEMARRDRGRQVPRLQQQISLYATMTGIKWDYAAENDADRGRIVLVGEMVRWE